MLLAADVADLLSFGLADGLIVEKRQSRKIDWLLTKKSQYKSRDKKCETEA
jgi:hypothetical protein